MKRADSGRVDLKDPQSNMYGCLPCPRCASKFRASFNRPDGLRVECGDCGYSEPGTAADGGDRG